MVGRIVAHGNIARFLFGNGKEASVFAHGIHAEGVINEDAYIACAAYYEVFIQRKEGLGKGEHKKDEGKYPSQQNEQMFELRPRLRILLYFLQKPHIGKPNLLVFPEVEKVDEDGNGYCREREEEAGIDELH
jgi:hypothetical protein